MARVRGEGEQTARPSATCEADVESSERSGLRALVPNVCWSFVGLGVYRAWIEACFVGSFVGYPSGYPLREPFDLTCALVLFALAFMHHRVAPLLMHPWARAAGVALMTLAAAGGFLAMWRPNLTFALAWACSIVGGAGLALVILLWSELYGCLSPVRIALYYALSQIVGAGVIWTLRGFALPWLWVYVCLLPLVSVLMLRAAFRTLPGKRLPRPALTRFTFPWKPALLVCVYAFAFGMQEASTYSFVGPHSGWGMLAAATVVAAGVTLLSRWIEFGVVYSAWLPIMMMAALLLSLVGSLGAFGASFFMSMSYGAAEIFIMTMVGSICYRYGASAVWLFGIERGVRMLAMMAGRACEPLAHGWPVAAAVIVAAAVGTALILSEKRLTSDWGVVLSGSDGEELLEVARRNALGRRCAEVGRSHGLTQREEEVLLLLAQRKTAGDVERELCVAYGTAKAHIRHVYKKLDVHSREELLTLVNMPSK